MGLEHWELERAELQAVLDDFNSGQLKLADGQDEYVANLKLRLRDLDSKLKRPSRAA